MSTATRNMVIAAAEGDRAAQNALVQKYQGPLEEHAARFSPHSASAADHVQNAWIRGFRSLNTLKDPSAFWGWLRSILNHVVLTARRKKRAALDGSEVLQQIPGADTSPSHKMFRGEAMSALAELPEDQRVAVTMWIDGSSYEEIAVAMQTTEDSTRGLIYRGLVKLRNTLPRPDST